ncbi:hypothetical protein GCM10008935_26140 [Alkalibacillus silvisoli]|uniref:UDP-glucose/GDP-mannose dehydrogenase C-terminal domain-containing protein n=1 Tax=Alkalibacillus silvisoli TaxID=392823 RepID=A0ABP3K397_9BACI
MPINIIQAIVDANSTRKDHIADRTLARNIQTVGMYRLTMKTDSYNFRQSAIQSIIERVRNNGVEVVIYEPSLTEDVFEGLKVINDFDEFKTSSDDFYAELYIFI